MAERLRDGESGTAGVRRIVRREAEKALKSLAARGQPSDKAVHDARKRIKRARAALRLVRQPLGDRRYRRENEALRDAARPLSEVRDAKILVEAFDALIDDAPRAGRAGLHRTREALIANQFRVRKRVFGRKEALEPTIQALRSARKRVGRWPAGRHGWSALGPGIRRVYRSGRTAFAEARANPSDVRLHEWRKQTKYLWHQLEMLEPLAPQQISAWARQAHQLSDYLGDDHDLAVLKARVRRWGGRVSRREAQAVTRLIERRRRELRAAAMALGERSYARRPRQFLERLEDLWRAWKKAS